MTKGATARDLKGLVRGQAASSGGLAPLESKSDSAVPKSRTPLLRPAALRREGRHCASHGRLLAGSNEGRRVAYPRDVPAKCAVIPYDANAQDAVEAAAARTAVQIPLSAPWIAIQTVPSFMGPPAGMSRCVPP